MTLLQDEQPDACSRMEPQTGSGTSLCDVLAIPIIVEIVLGKLDRHGVCFRLVCKSWREQVGFHFSSLMQSLVIFFGSLTPCSFELLTTNMRWMQYDRQVDYLRADIMHADNVQLARQLARKGVQPKTLSLDWHASDDAVTELEGALASGELRPLLQDVKTVFFNLHTETVPTQVFAVSASSRMLSHPCIQIHRGVEIWVMCGACCGN